MKINLQSRLKELDGKEVIVDNEPLTLASVFKVALLTIHKDDAEESADDKLWKWRISNEIEEKKNGEMDFTPEDIVKIKERVLKIYPSPIIYGNVCDLTDPK